MRILIYAVAPYQGHTHLAPSVIDRLYCYASIEPLLYIKLTRRSENKQVIM